MGYICQTCGRGFIPVRKSNPNRYCSYRCCGLARSRATHPNLTEGYFSNIDSPEKAYWLGFVLADGNVCLSPKSYSVRFTLCLAKKDEGHLDKFITAVGANPASKKPRQSGRSSQMSVVISNRVFCENLAQAGCVPRKSRVLRLPKLPTEPLRLALLLGYFDGDGSLVGPYRRSPIVVSGSRLFVQDLKDAFSIPWKIQTAKKGNYYRLCLGGPLFRRMLEAYPDSLSRKRLPETPRPA